MSAPDWKPTSDEDKKLADAVSGLMDSIGKGVQNIDDDKPNRFILHSKGYFDLRAYVMSGKELPPTAAEFERIMPQKGFATIEQFDSAIYPKTKSTLVGVGSSCGDFYDNQLTRLVNAAAAAIQYADNATELLTVAEGMNLRYHLNILLDPKYTNQASQDETFTESREAATMTLAMLKDDAENKKKEVDDIRARLLTLRTTTVNLQPDISFVNKQYKTGPVQNTATDPAKQEPYLDQLSKTYNTKLDDMRKKIDEAASTYEEWEYKTDMAIGFAFWPGIGWIVTAAMAAEAAALKELYDELKKEIEDMQRENAETLALITNVRMMIEHTTDIETKIGAAITAMTELSELFAQQAENYEKIAFYINGMSQGVQSDSATNRRTFVEYNLTKTVERLADLKSTALEFSKDIVYEIVNKT